MREAVREGLGGAGVARRPYYGAVFFRSEWFRCEVYIYVYCCFVVQMMLLLCVSVYVFRCDRLTWAAEELAFGPTVGCADLNLEKPQNCV